MKYCVLTANCKKDHFLFNDKFLDENNGVDYFYYTDSTLSHPIWKIKSLPLFSKIDNYSNRRSAKLPKMLGMLLHPGYDYYMWSDANIVFTQSYLNVFASIVDEQHDMFLFHHAHRNNIIQEAMEIMSYPGLEDNSLVVNQINYYTHNGTVQPTPHILYELPFFIYKASDKVLSFLLTWYEQMTKYSSRDQLSFPYCLKYYDLKIKQIPGTVYNNSFFYKVGHVH